MRNCSKAALSLGLGLWSSVLLAADSYRAVPLADLPLKAGMQLPAEGYPDMRMAALVQPRVELDGPGEAEITAQRMVLFHVKDNAIVTGRVWLPNPEASSYGGDVKPRTEIPLMIAVPFTYDAAAGGVSSAGDFERARAERYAGLIAADLPGEAWFRYRLEQVREKPQAQGDAWRGRRMNRDLESSPLDLFTSRAALRENLQLERRLRIAPGHDLKEPVALDTLAGIQTKAFDWKPKLSPNPVKLDPLAACIPADQHVVFFRSFSGMTTVMDEADARGTPIMQAFIPRSEDARTRARYQKQLCLDVTDLARVAGPYLVDSIAFTGSDLFLPTGSDVGIAFETKQPKILKAFLTAKHGLAVKADPAVKAVQGRLGEVEYAGVTNADRSVSAYVATRGNVVLISNSLLQLERLLQAAEGKVPAIAALDEYRFFRQRYARDDAAESAFVLFSDATIRRWCGPRWRILSERRAEAVAALSEAEAKLVLDPAAAVPASPEYGTLAFVTPIAEIKCDKVSKEEAEAYSNWRNGYERGWREFFDPIAIRLSVSTNRYAADVTVMPLIARSEYNEMLEVAKGGKIRARAGDPHPGVQLRLSLALNPEAQHVKDLSRMMVGGARGMPGLGESLAEPLAWVGKSLSLYLDNDPVLDKLLAHEPGSPLFMQEAEKQVAKLPLALWVESRNPVGLAAFMTAVRGMVNSSAPNMLSWKNVDYAGMTYVSIGTKPRAQGDDEEGEPGNPFIAARIHYATTPDALFVTLSESVMQGYLDRYAGTTNTQLATVKANGAARAMLGEHFCLQMDKRLMTFAENAGREPFVQRLRYASWANLLVLNELRAAAPGQDPVALYEKRWGVRLICPAGGQYVWNAKAHTMESTVTGHPGAPKRFDMLQGLLPGLSDANFGLTFEEDGLRARFELNREAVPAK